MSEVSKFKVGDGVLFTNRKYSRTEGTIISVVTEERERYKETEINHFYKIVYGRFFKRTVWVDQSDVKGLLIG